VIAGFFGRDRAGRIVTLGRGGTDYVAAFIASALHCDCVLLKDVEGIMSADPKIVASARLLSEVDYLTAMELAHYGSKVVFEKALAPAMKSGIAIRVASFLNPEQGTLIRENAGTATAVSFLSSVTNIKVTNPDPNAIQSLRRVLENSYADVLLSATDTSRSEISIAIRDEKADETTRTIKGAVPDSEVKITKRLGLVALTGSSLKTADIREILLKEDIGVHTVSVSASGRSVCSVLNSEHAEHAVRVLHSSVIT
jgi:aspartate kinase